MYEYIAIAVVIIIIYVMFFRAESFGTRREKATVIFEWFNAATSPTYTNYRVQIPDSDIVEYEKVRNIYTGGASPTVSDVERAL